MGSNGGTLIPRGIKIGHPHFPLSRTPDYSGILAGCRAEIDYIHQITDFCVLFFLFEMGLELSLNRLGKLRKYASSMDSLQVLFTSVVLGLCPYGIAETLRNFS